MSVDLTSLEADTTAWRRHIHQHPELGFHEDGTVRFILDLPESFGIEEVATGIGGTGIVATIRAGESNREIGLRADIDALPMTALTESDHTSCTQGAMHACGHDGHTKTMPCAAEHPAAKAHLDSPANHH